MHLFVHYLDFCSVIFFYFFQIEAMAQEITRYETKVKTFLLSREFHTIAKQKPRHIKVTSTSIVIDGKNEPYYPTKDRRVQCAALIDCHWNLTIPLDSIRDVFYQKFKAEGVMNNHRMAVGVEAIVDGALTNYAIFTDHTDDLFKIIQDSKPNSVM